MKTVKIDTRVSPELRDRLKEDAKKEGRTFCGHIRYLLESFYIEPTIMRCDIRAEEDDKIPVFLINDESGKFNIKINSNGNIIGIEQYPLANPK